MNIECSFPLGIRLWRWWCANGLKTRSGGTVGGSFFLRRLREYYSAFSGREGSDGCVRIEGKRVLFVDTLDLRTYQMVLPQLERNDMELLLAKWLTPPAGVFVDIGANVGVLSLMALSEQIGAVHSFEPNPAMMSWLCKTRSANPLAERWHLHELAIGASKSLLKLYVDTQFSGTASLVEAWQQPDKRSVDVQVVTLDHWCEVEHPTTVDVVKMDVEGWEFAVLEGANTTIRTYKPFIWFEHNLPALRNSGLDPRRVLDGLRNQGYNVFFDISRLPDRSPLSRRRVDEITDFRINFLAVPEERRRDFDTRVLPAMGISYHGAGATILMQSEQEQVKKKFDDERQIWEEMYYREDYVSRSFQWRKNDGTNLCREHVAEGGEILDLGCGTGHASYALARLGFNVVGIDISEGMVEQAKKNISSSGLLNCEFIAGDFSRIAGTLGVFDGILALGFIEYFDDPLKLLSLINGRLADHGVAVIQIWNSSPLADRVLSTAYRICLRIRHPANTGKRIIQAVAPRKISGKFAKDRNNMSGLNEDTVSHLRYTPDEFMRLADKAGFDIVSSKGSRYFPSSFFLSDATKYKLDMKLQNLAKKNIYWRKKAINYTVALKKR